MILSLIGFFVNILSNLYNYIMKLYALELINMLTKKEGITQKELTVILAERTGKKYTEDGFSRKINRGTIKYNEVADIIDVLGYDIEIEPKKVR